MKIKRYVVFAFYEFEGYGGWGDMKASFDTHIAAGDFIEKLKQQQMRYDCYQLLDLETGIVEGDYEGE